MSKCQMVHIMFPLQPLHHTEKNPTSFTLPYKALHDLAPDDQLFQPALLVSSFDEQDATSLISIPYRKQMTLKATYR